MVHRNYGSNDSGHSESTVNSGSFPDDPIAPPMPLLPLHQPASVPSKVDSKITWIPIDEASPEVLQSPPNGNGNVSYHVKRSPIVVLRDAYDDVTEKCGKISESWEFRLALKVLVHVVIGAYVIAACSLNFDDAKPVLFLYILALLFFFHKLIKFFLDFINHCPFLSIPANLLKDNSKFKCCSHVLSISFYIIITLLLLFVTIYWNYQEPIRLKSAGGLAFLILFAMLISKHKRHIKFQTVFWGLLLQFGFGIFVLRTEVGLNTFDSLGTAARDFMNFAMEGIDFVFKPINLDEIPPILGITTLMIIPFFSAFISALYYLGLMQFIIGKLAWVMQKTMGTSAVESISSAGNIFVGQTEAPLLVKPFLQTMTMSELHAIMTGGFATIAGGVFAAYVSMGVSASHLISASVMSAPAALSFSKIVYPETEKVGENDEEKACEQNKQNEPDKSEENSDSGYENLVHAIAAGATDGMVMVLNIIANLIAFLSLLAAFNYILAYLGDLINIHDLTLYAMFQYVFYPLAFILGADTKDCLKVGELLGLKTIANEFVAYDRMSHMMAGPEPLSARSKVIATYALCGFSNLGSIGIQIGGMGALAPNRKPDLARIGISAFITGNIACFSTACIAGLLYKSD
ncbi:putative transporter HI_0519 isoform X2 [Convolutriloba macropyga]